MVREHRRHEPANGMPGEIRRNITDPQPPIRIALPVGPLIHRAAPPPIPESIKQFVIPDRRRKVQGVEPVMGGNPVTWRQFHRPFICLRRGIDLPDINGNVAKLNPGIRIRILKPNRPARRILRPGIVAAGSQNSGKHT